MPCISGPGISFALTRMFRKDTKPETFILDFQKKYGDIMSFGIFSGSPVVFIFNSDLMKEVFIKNADFTSNRPSNMWLLNQLSKEKGEKNYFRVRK